MTQLPPAPREPHGDDGTDEWHALLRGELPRRAASADADDAARDDAAPPVADTARDRVDAVADTSGRRPKTRRELREAEQRRFAEEEAVRLIAEASIDEPSPSPSADGRRAAFAAPTVQQRAAVPAASSGASSAEPAERIRSTPTQLAELIDLGPGDPFEHDGDARPSRSERRAAASRRTDDAGHPRRRRGPWGCLVALIVVIALGVAAFFFLQGPIAAVIDRFAPPADYSGQGTAEVLFQIESGDTGSSIGARLVERDIVASEAAWLQAIEDAPGTVTFYPGVYRLAEQMSASAALDALTDEGNRLENTILIREGAWAEDVLAEASAVLEIPIEDFQAVAANPQALGLPAEATSLEGFLFPATYTFDPGVTAQQVVQEMVTLSLQAYDAAGVAPEDRYRVATLASLIEREGLPQDFGKVSRVIQNRLDQGMPLQFDSTVHYGIADHSEVTTTDAERADAGNPYNTYVHTGLTPGPIGNPGAEAIQAALNPEPGSWLYFVTVDPDTGETVFSTTYEEHEAAAQRFYQWLEEQPGDE